MHKALGKFHLTAYGPGNSCTDGEDDAGALQAWPPALRGFSSRTSLCCRTGPRWPKTRRFRVPWFSHTRGFLTVASSKKAVQLISSAFRQHKCVASINSPNAKSLADPVSCRRACACLCSDRCRGRHSESRAPMWYPRTSNITLKRHSSALPPSVSNSSG